MKKVNLRLDIELRVKDKEKKRRKKEEETKKNEIVEGNRVRMEVKKKNASVRYCVKVERDKKKTQKKEEKYNFWEYEKTLHPLL